MPKPEQTTKVVEVHRLSQEAYKALEASLPQTQPSPNYSAEWLLGIQHVLKKLREGFVTGER